MSSKTLALFLAGLLVLGLACPLWAKSSSSSSFSSSGSRSSSSGWSSSSRPRSSGPAAPSGWSSSSQKPSTPQGAWSNSTGTTAGTTSQSGSSSAFSSAGNSTVSRQAAASSYQDYQGRFAKTGNPIAGSSARANYGSSRTFNTYNEYNVYRDSYYSGRGWHTPGWAYMSYPSFGLWDSLFLWFMMSQLSGPGFFYNHQNDPGVQAFQAEAQRLAQSNADLKKQLDEMNAKLDALKKTNTPVDPKALPPDVDLSLAMAQAPVTQAQQVGPAQGQTDSGNGTLTLALLFFASVIGITYFVVRKRT